MGRPKIKLERRKSDLGRRRGGLEQSNPFLGIRSAFTARDPATPMRGGSRFSSYTTESYAHRRPFFLATHDRWIQKTCSHLAGACGGLNIEVSAAAIRYASSGFTTFPAMSVSR